MKKSMTKKFDFSKYAIAIVFVLICVLFAILSPKFLTPKNITNVLRQVAVNGILVNGMILVILTGGIDLSVGSILAVSSVVTAYLIRGGLGIGIAIVAALLVSMLFGLFNGYFVAKRGMAPFVVTMATNTIARGIAYIITDAKPIAITGSPLGLLNSTYFLGVPAPVYVLVGMCLIGMFLLYKTSLGRYIFAVGGNETTARVSGVNVDRVKLFSYIYCGLTCGVAAVVLTSKVTSGLCTAGDGYELDAIAAAVIGGTSLSGGRGRLWGAMIGVLIIGVLNNGLDLVGVSAYWQQIVKGAIILLAVMVDMLDKK